MAKANTKKTNLKEIDRTNWAFSTKGGHPKIVAEINKDIAAGDLDELVYSAGLADMLGTLYDFRYNGVPITLRIDGTPNILPKTLYNIVKLKVDKILNLSATNRGRIDERTE